MTVVDAEHGFFDLPGGEPPGLRVICSRLADQRSGDIVAIASAFFDGVGWRKPLSPCIDQQPRQQARLGGFSLAPMVAGIGSEPVSNSGPGLIWDQRRMLARMELTFVYYLTGVDRV